jgi:hypothetical protein
LGRA